MILLTKKERNNVYKGWLAKSVPGEALNFNALDEAQNKAQLKKVVGWLKPCILAEIYSPEAGADVICIGQRDWQALLKEVGEKQPPSVSTPNIRG